MFKKHVLNKLVKGFFSPKIFSYVQTKKVEVSKV